MTKHYEPEFRKKIVRLHLEEGRSIRSLADEYGVSKASISNNAAYTRSGKGTHKKCRKEEQRRCKGTDANLCDGAIPGESFSFKIQL